MAHNRQNDPVICKSVLESPAGKHAFCSMKPGFVMVWAAVLATWKSPLIFVDKNIKINSDVYISHILQPMSALMKRAWEKMPQSTLCAICDSVPKRIKLLLKK